jgi:hypothetical protein
MAAHALSVKELIEVILRAIASVLLPKEYARLVHEHGAGKASPTNVW